MKSLIIIPFTVLSVILAAQIPVNDDCLGIIDLGEAPYCANPGQFTNVGASASIIDPTSNIPNCFNNNAERDVWFQFSLPADGSLTDITIRVLGDVGGNGTLRMPQLGLYRGDCVFGGLSELACQAAPLNINELQLDFLGLNPGEIYILRINDYSATASPNAGTFRLCVEAYIPDFNIGALPGSESCSGTLWDSGGPGNPYSSGENLTFTICPLEFHQCIEINVLDYFTEEGFDYLRIFEGNGTSGLLVAELDGPGANEQINVSTGGCATIAFESDGSLEADGFQLTWQCSAEICPAPPPVPPAAATCDAALSINGCSTALPNTIVLEPGTGDPNFIVDGTNAGCILTPSANFSYAFFYFTAMADGNFGFLVKNGDPNEPSDLDFSVWGPIDNQTDICDFVTTHQPLRSSWTAAPDSGNPEGLTGLTDTNPYSGAAVTDAFDCGSPSTPGQGTLPTDDSFVSTLPVIQGKIYVFMLDDYSRAISSANGISIDFSGTTDGVLDPSPGSMVTVSDDLTICQGTPTQLLATGGLDYAWSPNATLSCDQCPDPLALPGTNTTYEVQIATVCARIKDSVTVNLLDLDLGPDANVCVGAFFTLNENAIPGDYAWIGSQNLNCTDCPSPVFTATSPGVYIVGCIITTPFCSDTDFIKITVAGGLQPILSIAADQAICIGAPISLGGPSTVGHTYSWSSDPPGFSSNISSPPAFSPAETTTYFVEINSVACPFTRLDSVVVTVYQPPVLSLISGASICLGDSIVLGNTGFQPDVSYLWNPDDGSLDDKMLANPTATPQTAGLHNYTLTASNPGCSVGGTVPIVAVALQLDLSVADTVHICKGIPQEIVVSVTPLGTPVSWTPVQNLQLSPDGLTGLVSPADNFTYTVSATISGCTRSQQVFVQVDSLPLFLGVSPMDTSICIGSIVLLESPDDEPLYEPSNFPDIIFSWAPGIGQLSSDTLSYLYVQPTETVTYRRIVTNGGCADTVFATVNVIEPPEMTILPEMAAICPDSFVLLTVTAPGIDSLLWSPAASLSCSDCLTPIATPLSSTTYTLSGKYKGCPVTKSTFVTVNPAPIYQFPAIGNLCSGTDLQLNLLDDPSVSSYTWTSNPPSVIPPVAQPTVSLNAMGLQSFTYYLEAFNGCSIQDSFSVQVSGVSLMLSAPDTLCPETPKLLTASASLGGGQYTWSTGATTQAINVIPTQTTTYTVTYMLNGCTYQDSVKLVTQGQTPAIVFPSDAILCAGESITLNSAETPGASYSWSSNIGGFSSSVAIPDPQVLFESTTYTVMATSPDGCSITKTLDVKVFNATLNVSDDIVICAGMPFSVSATGSLTGTYQWTPGNITTPSFNKTLNTAQTIDYALLYTYGTVGNECFLHDTVQVSVLPSFTVKIVADPDSVFNAGEEIMLDAVIQPSQSINGFTFQWIQQGGEVVGTPEQRITFTPMTIDTSIEFTVIVTSPNGCTASAKVRFRVQQSNAEVPNAFSPNGDGANDVFRLAVIEGKVTVEHLEIYSRWGQKVYESFEADASWDGRIVGKDAPSDVYVYKIRWRNSDGSLRVESGELTLLR